MRQEQREMYEAAKSLAKAEPTDPTAQLAFLLSLPDRTAATGVQVVRNNLPNQEDKTPPLSPSDLDFVLASYKTLRHRRPDWVHSGVLANVSTELKRAKKPEQNDALYEESVAVANQPDSVANVLALAAERGNVDACVALFDKFERLQGGKPYISVYSASGTTANPPESLARLIGVRAKEKAWADVLKIVGLLHRFKPETARRFPARRRRNFIAICTGGNYYQLGSGNNQNSDPDRFPAAK